LDNFHNSPSISIDSRFSLLLFSFHVWLVDISSFQSFFS
jgi:hypothetical protein